MKKREKDKIEKVLKIIYFFFFFAILPLTRVPI